LQVKGLIDTQRPRGTQTRGAVGEAVGPLQNKSKRGKCSRYELGRASMEKTIWKGGTARWREGSALRDGRSRELNRKLCAAVIGRRGGISLKGGSEKGPGSLNGTVAELEGRGLRNVGLFPARRMYCAQGVRDKGEAASEEVERQGTVTQKMPDRGRPWFFG